MFCDCGTFCDRQPEQCTLLVTVTTRVSRVFWIACLVLPCWALGCSNSPPDAPVVDLPPERQNEVLGLAITGPTDTPGWATTRGLLNVSGVVVGASGALQWSTNRGASGTVDALALWTIPNVPIEVGETIITVSAGNGASRVEVRLIVTRTDFLQLLDRPVVGPRLGLVGEVLPVSVSALVDTDEPALALSSLAVLLERHDGSFSELEALVDNGDFFASGDEVPGDQRFGAAFGLTGQQPSTSRLWLKAESKDGVVARIPLGDVMFLPRLSQADFDEAARVVTVLQAVFDDHSGEAEAARQAVLDAAATEPAVKRFGRATNGYGVWVELTGGLRGALLLAPEGTLGSPRASVFHSGTPGVANADACPGWLVAEPADTMAPTLSELASLPDYGAVLWTTHGDALFDGAVEVLETGEPVAPSARSVFETELMAGQLVLGGRGRFYVTAAFFDALPRRFPGTLVVLNACRSLYSGRFALALARKGASAVIGWSDYVTKVSADAFLTELIACLSEPKRTLAHCYEPRQDPGRVPPAVSKLFGPITAALRPPDGLRDGGMESGPAWLGSGDHRILRRAGAYLPPQGQFVGAVSTGFGPTTTAGSLWQRVCVPAGTTSVQFRWNFASDEFMTSCGNPKYQDRFTVTLATPSLSIELLSREIDDLCDSVSPSLFDVPDSGYTDEDGQAWATGWQSFESDAIAQFAGTGEPVELRFAVSDEGDSLFDSVLLIDDVRLVSE